jgi:hypothetical protein
MMDRWMEYFLGKLSDQGQINSKFEVEEFDFNVKNNGISESRYLKVRCTKYIPADYYLWSRLTHIKPFTSYRFRNTSCQKG